MPWKELSVDVQRQQMCYRIVHGLEPVVRVCAELGVSRKTAYKWLKVYRGDPSRSLADRSRRPVHSPGRTDEAMERRVLGVRDEHGWGARKLHVLLGKEAGLPSLRTVGAILKRHGRTRRPEASPEPASPPRSFERSAAHQMWQMDHMGPREIQRRRWRPLTVIDDHSRFCFCFEPLIDTAIERYWPVLWEIFGIVGLPESILSDNAFGAWGMGLSELEMRLIRLGIRPLHGRAFHPQTQGKVERIHRTLDEEFIDFNARTDSVDLFRLDRDRYLRTYNFVRPHESLGDKPPISRFTPNPRKRPQDLPPVDYPADAVVRKVSQVGDIHFAGRRIGLTRSLAAQYVRVEERNAAVNVFYAWKQLRSIPLEQLAGRHKNERI